MILSPLALRLLGGLERMKARRERRERLGLLTQPEPVPRENIEGVGERVTTQRPRFADGAWRIQKGETE